MIPKILVSPDLPTRVGEINKILSQNLITNPHLDLLYFSADTKLGIEQAKQIRQHLSFKPIKAQGKIVVLEDASALTVDAQNALLKTLEELPDKALVILGASSESKLLPTVLSRCQITRLTVTNYDTLVYHSKFTEDIQKLLKADLAQRFEYIEKLKDKEEFLKELISCFRQLTLGQPNYHLSGENTEYLEKLLLAERWASQNVNIRAILEYLMLSLD